MLAVASGNCREWNAWRIDHPGVLLSLISIEFGEISLPYINLNSVSVYTADRIGKAFPLCKYWK
jgi:hypothetical protein